MPAASDILLGLTRIATDAAEVSIAWHVALVTTFAALLLSFRPQRRVAAAALGLPLASVAIVAIVFDNPFNAAVFLLLAAALAVLALGAPHGTATLRSDWSAVLGWALIVFGAVYPHFVEGATWLTYLYAAPLGVIPCPTLSVVIGVALLAGGFGLGAFRVVLAAVGGFYAVFGALRLGVLIDVFLLCGAAGLLIQYGKDRVDARTTDVARTV
jgi:hypothetical protein